MSLERMLQTAEECFIAGLRWSDEDFELHKEKIVEGVAKEGPWSYEAGFRWLNKRFLSHAEIIAEGVTKNRESNLNAIMFWIDKRYFPVAEILAKGVAKNVDRCHEAGKEMSDERFLPVAEIIVKGIAKDHYTSYMAGKYWSDEKFMPFAEMLTKKVAKDVEISYKAGEEWSDERFIYLQELHQEDSFFSRNVNARYRKQWFEFADKCDKDKLLDLPLIDFYKAADVLDHVRPHGGEKKFFESFNVILGRGEVRPWTREILKRIENVGKGGTNYRVLEVAA